MASIELFRRPGFSLYRVIQNSLCDSAGVAGEIDWWFSTAVLYELLSASRWLVLSPRIIAGAKYEITSLSIALRVLKMPT
jgi:hypothetical protein